VIESTRGAGDIVLVRNSAPRAAQQVALQHGTRACGPRATPCRRVVTNQAGRIRARKPCRSAGRRKGRSVTLLEVPFVAAGMWSRYDRPGFANPVAGNAPDEVAAAIAELLASLGPRLVVDGAALPQGLPSHAMGQRSPRSHDTQRIIRVPAARVGVLLPTPQPWSAAGPASAARTSSRHRRSREPFRYGDR